MARAEHSADRRITALVVLLCLTLLGQWSAIFAEYRQHEDGDHCCLLCHIGPQASLDGVAPVAIPPEFSVAPAPRPAETAVMRQAPVAARSSRAPPSDSLS